MRTLLIVLASILLLFSVTICPLATLPPGDVEGAIYLERWRHAGLLALGAFLIALVELMLAIGASSPPHRLVLLIFTVGLGAWFIDVVALTHVYAR